MLSFGAALAEHRALSCRPCPQRPLGVKASLTRPRRRPRQHRENTDFGAMVLRVIRAYGRRVASGDPEDLTVMLACSRAMDTALAAAVAGGREQLGWTWADVGRAAGVTRQAAHARWSDQTTAGPADQQAPHDAS